MEQKSQASDRAPCPDRILEDAGGAFTMGAVGGFALHFIKGLRNSPKGYRLRGGVQAAYMNSPRIGGSFAVWCSLFSATDCALVFMRQKEDPWNSIIAGATTGGLLSMRKGLGAICKSSISSACLLAAFEGFLLVNTRLDAQNKKDHNIAIMEQQQSTSNNMPPPLDDMSAGFPYQVSSPSSWFSSRIKGFLGGREDASAGGSGSKMDILESDAPPLPTFDYN